MVIAKITVDGVKAVATEVCPIPKGIIGATIEIQYSREWAGLNKTVVFRGRKTLDVLNAGNTVTVPQEVVATVHQRLLVGIYGTDNANNLAIPTLWADLGVIRDATDPSGDVSADPSLPVWAQLEARIGNMDRLSTAAKSSIVEAVNEVHGDVDDLGAELGALGKTVSAQGEAIGKLDADLTAVEEKVEEHDGELKELSQAVEEQGAELEALQKKPVLPEAVAELLVTILQEALYGSDQSGSIKALAELLGVEVEDEPEEPVVPDEPDDPVILKLDAPVIRLESESDSGDTEDTENTPAILGVAVLGRTILGDYGESDSGDSGELTKLGAPVIRLETDNNGEEIPKLAAPVIRLEADLPKLAAPVISLETVMLVLDAPVIELVEV